MLWRKYVQDLAVMRGAADDGEAASKAQSASKQVVLNLHDTSRSQAKGCTKTTKYMLMKQQQQQQKWWVLEKVCSVL